jgi:hypothetical protein
VTDFGITQFAYTGTPLTSELDVGYNQPNGDLPVFPVDIVNRGKWIDVTQNATTGVITASAPYTKRTPWYTDTDFNLKQSYKLGEVSSLSFDATFTNVLNQHRIVSNWEEIDSTNKANNFIEPGGFNITKGLPFYAAATSPYNYLAEMNTGSLNGTRTGPITIDSQYGKTFAYQVPRNIILGAHITF